MGLDIYVPPKRNMVNRHPRLKSWAAIGNELRIDICLKIQDHLA